MINKIIDERIKNGLRVNSVILTKLLNNNGVRIDRGQLKVLYNRV